jgi:phosphatidylserine/phosphatidylglycerophosphate/cardiolipin synthase-like enzyme
VVFPTQPPSSPPSLGQRVLTAEDLARVPDSRADALLAYLNLPPLGALADEARAVSGQDDADFEVPARVRTALLERRLAAGGAFRALADLVGVGDVDAQDLAAMLARLSDRSRYGHRVRPVWGGPEAEREFFALLESAQRYIHISTYIIGGEAGLRMARILARKQREGVKVRLLFCASGFVVSGSPSGTGFVSRLSELRSYLLNDRYYRKRIVAELRAGQVPFLNSAPICRHWTRRDFRAQGVKSRRDYERWARARGLADSWLDEQEHLDEVCGAAFANVDHRKMVIVDGERAFIGSQNIADSYFYGNELSPDARVNVRRWQWHDNSAVLEGGVIRKLNRLFLQRWALSGGDLFDAEDAFYAPVPTCTGHAVLATQTSIPGMLRLPWRRNWPRLLLSLLGGDLRPVAEGENPIRQRMLGLPALARESFDAEHCYPSDADLLTRWSAHAARGLTMNLIVPEHYDTVVTGYECDRFFPELLAAGVKVWGYRRAILHSKLAMVDGFYVATGSYNLTLRSARADLELEFFIQCPDYGGAVRERLARDREECALVVPSPVDRLRRRASLPIFDAIVRYFLL